MNFKLSHQFKISIKKYNKFLPSIANMPPPPHHHYHYQQCVATHVFDFCWGRDTIKTKKMICKCVEKKTKTKQKQKKHFLNINFNKNNKKNDTCNEFTQAGNSFTENKKKIFFKRTRKEWQLIMWQKQKLIGGKRLCVWLPAIKQFTLTAKK